MEMAAPSLTAFSGNGLSGIKKAAIFLLAVGKESASLLFEHMEESEIKKVSQEMSSLGMIDSETVEQIFQEFGMQVTGAGGLVGTMDSTERLLSKVLTGDKVSDIMEDIRGPAGKTMWDKLGNINEEVLGNYLRNEYPQTVSLILSKIKPEKAARVLSVLPEDFSKEVIIRMLKMEDIQKEVLDDVERTLRTEFMTNIAKASKSDPHEMMASIFNSLDRETEGNFMDALEEREKGAAERIRSLMFTFDDLTRLDNRSMQVFLRNFDKTTLPVALKGCSQELQDLFFSNMSARAGKILKDDMENMGPVRLKDVEEAQHEAVQLAKNLADKGEIIISEGGDDEMIA